ncbi:MAG: hypothetical protein V1743_08280 [Nanoarchaeota archaeon]
MNKTLEATIKNLEKEITASRPNMKAVGTLIYANEETGTAVYQVYTANNTLPYPITEFISWTYFLAGNNEGYADGGHYVSSEAYAHIGQVVEDKEKVTVPISGTGKTYFDLPIELDDCVFKKKNFKPYTAKQ